MPDIAAKNRIEDKRNKAESSPCTKWFLEVQ